VGCVELRGNAGLEDALLLEGRDAGAVVDDGDETAPLGLLGGHEDMARPGIAGVAQELDEDVLRGTDVLGGLAPLGLRRA